MRNTILEESQNLASWFYCKTHESEAAFQTEHLELSLSFLFMSDVYQALVTVVSLVQQFKQLGILEHHSLD